MVPWKTNTETVIVLHFSKLAILQRWQQQWKKKQKLCKPAYDNKTEMNYINAIDQPNIVNSTQHFYCVNFSAVVHWRRLVFPVHIRSKRTSIAWEQKRRNICNSSGTVCFSIFVGLPNISESKLPVKLMQMVPSPCLLFIIQTRVFNTGKINHS